MYHRTYGEVTPTGRENPETGWREYFCKTRGVGVVRETRFLWFHPRFIVGETV